MREFLCVCLCVVFYLSSSYSPVAAASAAIFLMGAEKEKLFLFSRESCVVVVCRQNVGKYFCKCIKSSTKTSECRSNIVGFFFLMPIWKSDVFLFCEWDATSIVK